MNGEPSQALSVVDGQVLASTTVQQSIIRPLGTPDEALAAWEAFQELKAKLITTEDVQDIQGKPRITKSGWRKIATAFGIDTELIKEARLPKETGGGFVVECVVRAIAPNGRHCDGVGSFDSTERRMAHPEHDVRATAFTRACNRAISDLVGGGEVSAEEIHEANGDINAQRKAPPRRQATPAAAPSPVDDDGRLICEECGAELGEIRFRDGTAWLPAQLASLGRRKHGRVLCMSHYREANEARRRAQGTDDVSF